MKSDDVLALSPRMGLLEPELKSASSAAARLGIRVEWVGFSSCAVKATNHIRWGEDIWLGAEGTPLFESKAAPQCDCRAPCDGYPMDYIERFGWTEFRNGPETRVDAVVRRMLSSGGAFPRGDEAPNRVRVAFGAPVPAWHASLRDSVSVESSRAIRQRMVEAAQLGAKELVVCNSGALQHPAAEDLLWEMTRLSFERVSLAGELSALSSCSQRVFRRFRGIHRVDGAWFGPNAERHDEMVGSPGAFEATEQTLLSMKNYAGAEIGMYALLRSADELKEYLQLFASKGYTPHFRLVDGIDMGALAKKVKAIEDSQIQAHIGGLMTEDAWNGPRTATQYALLASLGTAGRTTLASSSGALVDWLNGDWGIFFIITALMVIPSLILLYVIKNKIKLND